MRRCVWCRRPRKARETLTEKFDNFCFFLLSLSNTCLPIKGKAVPISPSSRRVVSAVASDTYTCLGVGRLHVISSKQPTGALSYPTRNLIHTRLCVRMGTRTREPVGDACRDLLPMHVPGQSLRCVTVAPLPAVLTAQKRGPKESYIRWEGARRHED